MGNFCWLRCSWLSASSVGICRLSVQRASKSPSRAACKKKKWCGLGFHHQCTFDVFNLQCNQVAWRRSRSFETFSSIGKKRYYSVHGRWWLNFSLKSLREHVQNYLGWSFCSLEFVSAVRVLLLEPVSHFGLFSMASVGWCQIQQLVSSGGRSELNRPATRCSSSNKYIKYGNISFEWFARK